MLLPDSGARGRCPRVLNGFANLRRAMHYVSPVCERLCAVRLPDVVQRALQPT